MPNPFLNWKRVSWDCTEDDSCRAHAEYGNSDDTVESAPAMRNITLPKKTNTRSNFHILFDQKAWHNCPLLYPTNFQTLKKERITDLLGMRSNVSEWLAHISSQRIFVSKLSLSSPWISSTWPAEISWDSFLQLPLFWLKMLHYSLWKFHCLQLIIKFISLYYLTSMFVCNLWQYL